MKLRVLVIDDDEIFNLMADVVLRSVGMATHPRCFTSGEEALAYINQHSGGGASFLLFLDINMPTMSGWEVLDAVRSLPYAHRIHVVIVTSSIDSADKKKAANYEQVIDYMVKPLNREKLASLKQHDKIAPFFSR